MEKKPLTNYAILRELEREELSSLYLFLGEDWGREEVIAKIKNLLFKDPTFAKLNTRIVHPDETELAEIVNLIEAVPLLGSKQLILLKRADELSLTDKKGLATYLRDNSLSNCLVILAKKLEGKDPLYKAALEKGRAVNFYKLYDLSASKRFIVSQVKKAKKEISSTALDLLIEKGGRNQSILEATLDKLLLYTGEKKEIGKEDVLAVAGEEEEETIFDLIELIGRKKKEKALLTLNHLLKEGVSPLKILALINWHWHRLLNAKRALGQKESKEKMAGSLKVNPRMLDSLLTQAKSFPQRSLLSSLEDILETDRALKSFSSPTHSLIMELLILKLAG